MKCIHCRSSSCLDIEGHPDFSTESAVATLDQIASFADPVIVLSGGEPLLRNDIFDIASYGTKKGFRMALATNGSLVTDSVCESIKEAGIKIVSLSLDGATESIHDDFRKQPGSFKATINAAHLFNKHGIKFLVNSSFSKRNQHDIANCFKRAKRLGAQAWYLFMVVPTGRGEALMQELISQADYQEILDWHYKIEQEEDALLMRPTCAPHYYRIRFEHNRLNDSSTKSRPLSFSPGGSKGCLAGQTIALLDVDGNVLPCSYLPISAGNVFSQRFSEIWAQSELFNKFRDYKRYKGRCGNCEYIKVCGGCRARAYTINDDYMAEEPFCNYVPSRLR